MLKLESIEWHDLPVKNFIINEALIKLDVLSYSEASKEYGEFSLELFNFENIELSINSSMNFKELDELEIAHFDYELDGELISGKIQILPGNKGLWEIKFEKSKWVFEGHS